MTIAATAGSTDVQQTEVDDALPDNLEPVWRKLNKPMMPITIGSQGKVSKPRSTKSKAVKARPCTICGKPSKDGHCERVHVKMTNKKVEGHDEEENLQGATGDALEEKDDENIHEAELENTYEDEETLNDLTQYASIRKGDMVAVYIEHHWESNPQIGQVLEVNQEAETILIHWYYSTWSGKSGALYLGGGAHRKPKTESLDIRSVLLWQFKLTQAKYLTSSTVQKLKMAYKELGLHC